MTSKCLASWELIVVNVLWIRIDVHFYSIVHFQWPRWGLSLASAYVDASLFLYVNPRAYAIIISAFCGDVNLTSFGMMYAWWWFAYWLTRSHWLAGSIMFTEEMWIVDDGIPGNRWCILLVGMMWSHTCTCRETSTVVSVGQSAVCIIVTTVMITTTVAFTCSTGSCVVMERSMSAHLNFLE